jgi:hypothetical protein
LGKVLIDAGDRFEEPVSRFKLGGGKGIAQVQKGIREHDLFAR